MQLFCNILVQLSCNILVQLFYNIFHLHMYHWLYAKNQQYIITWASLHWWPVYFMIAKWYVLLQTKCLYTTGLCMSQFGFSAVFWGHVIEVEQCSKFDSLIALHASHSIYPQCVCWQVYFIPSQCTIFQVCQSRSDIQPGISYWFLV